MCNGTGAAEKSNRDENETGHDREDIHRLRREDLLLRCMFVYQCTQTRTSRLHRSELQTFGVREEIGESLKTSRDEKVDSFSQ